MRHAGPTRREIGVRTAFNLLGPLTNPAGASRQLIGVGDPAAAPRLAEVLRALGTERSFVVHGAGIDELPLDGSGVLYASPTARSSATRIDAADLGFARAATGALAGGSPAENAAIVEAILEGEQGPRRDVVLLNAGAALLVAGRAERWQRRGSSSPPPRSTPGRAPRSWRACADERRAADAAPAEVQA